MKASGSGERGRTVRVLKGHGTENDFIVLPDPDGTLDPDVALVRALCDRRAGLGADGVLRVVRTEHLRTETPAETPGSDTPAAEDDSVWFMDYRNADGSVAEMCGNGIRVMARYLREAGFVDTDTVRIGTRAGALTVRYESDGAITAGMGAPRLGAEPVRVGLPGWGPRAGRPVWMPNPHVVVPVPDETTLAGLDLTVVPRVAPVSPDGQNVEFVHRRGPRHLALRVHERGVGETRSCGTGICAALVATIADTSSDDGSADPAAAGANGGDDQWWQIDVPGGTCWARWTAGAGAGVDLRGPAVLVAEARVDLDALGAGRSPGA